MSKLKDKEDTYKFLNSPIIKGDDLLPIEDIIKPFKTRFDNLGFGFDYLNDKNFYFSSVHNTEHLFAKARINEKKPLAVSLIQLLNDHFCKKELLPPARWFFAGVIYTCFNYLKEDDQKFREAFCSFDQTEGNSSQFCRLVTIAAIEYYCRVKQRDVTDFYKTVIKFDGEVISYSKNTENEVVLKAIWLEWCKHNQSIGIKAYNALWKYDGIGNSFLESVYWTIRHPMATLIMVRNGG